MKRLFEKIPAWILYLAVLFFFLLIIFSSFRYALFSLCKPAAIPENIFGKAFSSGIRYDIMVSSYLIIIPSLSFFTAMFFNFNSKWFRKIITFYFSLVFMLVFLCCCADIPYSETTGSRLNNAIIMWTDTPGTMLGFVFSSAVYYPYLAVFFIGLILSMLLLFFSSEKIIGYYS